MYRRILIPLDGSSSSEAALKEGLELARLVDATVTFLHIVEDPVVNVYGVVYGQQMARDLLKAGDDILDAALKRAGAANIPARSVLVTDKHPADAILTAEEEADLVVMGTHGRRGMGRLVMGSVTEEVVRRSSKPHLTVRAEAT